MPKVSVIICTRNRIKALKEAIETIYRSTLNDYELLVVEGNCVDDTHQMLVNLYLKNMLKHIYNPGNRIENRNLGWKYATGEYVCFLDDDDTQSIDRLEAQAKYLDEHPEISVVSCTTAIDKSLVIGPTINNLTHEEIVELIKKNDIDTVINFQSCMFRKSDVDKYLKDQEPFLKEFIEGCEGSTLLYELIYNAKLKFANITNALYFYNVGKAPNSLTNTFIPKYYNDNIRDKGLRDRKKFIKNIRIES